MTEYTFHPIAELFPLMVGAEFDALKNDIAANGLREAIWLHPDDWSIIDGRNRYRACVELGIEPEYRTWDGEGSLEALVDSLNLHRRHLTKEQRDERMRMLRAKGLTYKQVADMVGVGEATAWRVTSDLSNERSEIENERGQLRPAHYAPRQLAQAARDDPALAREVLDAAKELKAARLNSTVTYHNQPAIHATRGTVPLAGTSHVYTAEKLLWPEAVEDLLAGLLVGRSLHVCCGKSQLGDMRLDLHEPDADIRADAANIPLPDKSFDTVLCDPPYNGEYQWNHDMLAELARLACSRIVFQHWFVPADPDGLYRKAHTFQLTQIYVWQPRTYFGRAQLISVFEVNNGMA